MAILAYAYGGFQNWGGGGGGGGEEGGGSGAGGGGGVRPRPTAWRGWRGAHPPKHSWVLRCELQGLRFQAIPTVEPTKQFWALIR